MTHRSIAHPTRYNARMPEGNPPTLEYDRPHRAFRVPLPLMPAILAAITAGLGYACAVVLAMELMETDAGTGRHEAAIQHCMRVVEFPLLTIFNPSSKDAAMTLIVLNGCLWAIGGGLVCRAWQLWRRQRGRAA